MLLSAKCQRAKIKRGGQNLSRWERNLADHRAIGFQLAFSWSGDESTRQIDANICK